jgi:uridine phosphorylase
MRNNIINKEKPLIVPRLSEPHMEIMDKYHPTKAILAFLPVGNMSVEFGNKGDVQSAFLPYWESWNWRGWIREDGIILAGPIWGGSMCATIIEELSVLGVEHFIGYGASGSLDSSISLGSIMVAESSFCSDGTSREYSGKEETYPDSEMTLLLKDIIQRHGIKPVVGKVWSTDAIYREYPSKVTYWKHKGAKFVNMDTASLFAVTAAKGLKAAYLSAVSDILYDDRWSGWHTEFDQPLETVRKICLEIAAEL